MQINTLSLTRKPNNVGSSTVNGMFSAESWQYDPKPLAQSPTLEENA
ncbi:MAG: hypothetical protein WCT12_09435 [Verrucomicrobiota bacterium]